VDSEAVSVGFLQLHSGQEALYLGPLINSYCL